ncbi:MAG: AAA family ATPase [Verrucomicrobiae bacterium]|nr:AAA family ATPase [Verrucomicrobiae bacterium]
MLRIAFALALDLVLLALLPLRLVRRWRAAPEGAWLEVKIDGGLTEVARRVPFWQRRHQPVALHSLRRVLAAVRADTRVTGVLFRIDALRVGSARATSLRDLLLALRAAGKKVAVYLPHGGGTLATYVASAADQVLLGPETHLDLTGFAIEATYLRGVLDRAGIEPEVFAKGRFKTAGEFLEKKSMSDAQREAVRAAITSKLVVITGGPGVGKTTIIRGIVKILAYKKARIALCAPTGRAAKRLSESCSYFAQTIHRLLKYDPQDHDFTHHAANPIEADLVVVDETSMLDVPLAFHLLNAIPPTASVVLVGDVDQLPSVGPGNFLRDVIDSGIAPVIRLNQIFRQHHRSQIVVNAHRVNEGKLPENSAATPMLAMARDLTGDEDSPPADPEAGRPGECAAAAPSANGLSTASDFHLLPADSPEAAVRRIVKLVSDEIPRAFQFDPIEEIQVMAPMHRGVCGVENLNRELQAALNPKRADPKFRLHRDGVIPEIERFGRLYRIGDKVMQIRNNYDKDVFNGDLGRVVAIDRDAAKLSVRVDERLVEYEFTDLDELLPAYAISIHKSQGSEYPVVVIPILTQHYVMLQRNLLYTAITRGKKLVVVVGAAKALAIAVRNDKTAQRYGMLKARLMERDGKG